MELIGCRLRDVCFVHWPVDPDVLETRLPHELTAATHDGMAWVSFLATRTRPMAGPVALPAEFSQCTVRTYVRAGGREAVYFLRVDVDCRLAAAGGRSIFRLPFRYVDATVTDDGGGVRVRSHAPGGSVLFDATFDRASEPAAVDGDSRIGWLTDRSTYALGDGRTATVDHGPWSVARTDVDVRTDEVLPSEGLAADRAVPRFRYSPGAEFSLRSWPSHPPDRDCADGGSG